MARKGGESRTHVARMSCFPFMSLHCVIVVRALMAEREKKLVASLEEASEKTNLTVVLET